MATTSLLSHSRSALQTLSVSNSTSPASRGARKRKVKGHIDLTTKTRAQPKEVQVTPLNAGTDTRSKLTRTPWSTRRFTPYQKAPSSRLLRTPHTVHARKPRARKQSDEQSAVDERLFELVNKTWRMYKVSPLYKFDSSSACLRHYASLLSAHIKAEMAKGIAVGADSETADVAQFSIFKGIKCTEDEPEAIQITLKQKPVRGKGSGEARVVLTALLCCVGATIDDLQGVHSDFSLRPLLLVRGPLGLTSHLHHFLQSQFDCHVSPVNLSGLELSWMVTMWAGYAPEKGGKPVHLEYRVPNDVTGLNTISLDIDPQDCAKLWKSVHDSENESFLASEVVTLIRSIEAHFHHHFRINLAAMSLHRVGTATMFVGAEGKLKLFSASHTQQVFSHLTQILLERTLRR